MYIKKIRDYLGIIIIIAVIISAGFLLRNKHFDESQFNVNKEYQHIVELTSPKYEGRLAGSKGNQLALNYVEDYFKTIGLEPGGDEGTFYQNFKSIVPVNTTNNYLKIYDSKGHWLKEYFNDKDFS